MDHSERSQNPASLICFRYTNQAATSVPSLKLYKNLTELDLSGNCLSSELTELQYLKYLKKLSISSNHITTPWQFPKTLEYLNLSCNHIQTFPSIQLPRLIFLDLSCNLITSLDPLTHISQLKTLYLGYNLIQNLSPLEKLKNLLEIDLEHNILIEISQIDCLIASNVLVFTLKNNPGIRSEFKKYIKENHTNINERNEVFCKDLIKATNASCRLIKENFGGGSSETARVLRVKSEYTSHVAKKDVIREEDEFNEGLINEVEELRQIIERNDLAYKKIYKANKTFKKHSRNCEIERRLMRLSELERESQLEDSRLAKLEKIEAKHRAKYTMIVTATQKLEKKLRESQAELEKRKSEATIAELEKYRMHSDLQYLRNENEQLKGEILAMTQKYLGKNKKSISMSGQQVLKSQSTKNISKSTIPKIKLGSKDSLIVSPMSNASLPTVAHFSKRRESFDRENSRIIKILPITKGKTALDQPIRPKRSFQ